MVERPASEWAFDGSTWATNERPLLPLGPELVETRVVAVRGWALSETEASLLALAAL